MNRGGGRGCGGGRPRTTPSGSFRTSICVLDNTYETLQSVRLRIQALRPTHRHTATMDDVIQHLLQRWVAFSVTLHVCLAM